MASDAKVTVSVNLSVMVPGDHPENIVKVCEVISRAQMGLALEGYTATVMMMTHTEEPE